MENLYIFILSFTLVFLTMLVLYLKKRKRGQLVNSKEIKILIARFKLDKKKLNYEALGLILILVNSLIIATTGTLASAINLDYVWQLMIAFVVLMILIYSSYALIGLYLKRRENKK